MSAIGRPRDHGLDGHPWQAEVAADLERLTVYADAQERKVSQLQSALESRVVIEQAIGMLAERFGPPFTDAFELLRAGARNTRQQVRAVADELRDSRQTRPRSPTCFRETRPHCWACRPLNA